MTPDELWKKYSTKITDEMHYMGPYSFRRALKEYGESVRQQAVRVCDNHTGSVNQLAAAIEKMEIK